MPPDQITQLRQLLNRTKGQVETTIERAIYSKRAAEGPGNKALGFLEQALALLPCPTCNDRYKQIAGGMPCPDCQQPENPPNINPAETISEYPESMPDCQPKLCVCCDIITEENAHLHRNCGK
jgi:hypothetical protein